MADTKLTQNVSFFNAYAEKKQLFERMDYIVNTLNDMRLALPNVDLSRPLQDALMEISGIVRDIANMNYQENKRNNPYFTNRN